MNRPEGAPACDDGQMTDTASRPKRKSITPTYDSRETGPRYHVTTWINRRVIVWEHRVDDPFVRQTVHVSWRDLLRSLLRRELVVEVSVGADRDVMEDVLELDANALGYNCTRRDEFSGSLNAALSAFAGDDPAGQPGLN